MVIRKHERSSVVINALVKAVSSDSHAFLLDLGGHGFLREVAAFQGEIC